MLPSAPKTSPTHSPSPDSSKLAASVSSTPASTAIFYGSSSPAKSLGSTHTKYYAPPSDSIPAVATAAVFHQPQPQQPSHTPHWTEGYQPNPEGWRAPEAVPLDAVSTSGVANPEDRQWGYNSPDFRAIDMTVLEGPQWWDKEGQNRLPYKPGPGLLPPGVEELVHADGHSLYQVSIIPPEIPPMSPPPSAQSFPSSTSSVPATPPPTPPSTAEINEAIPSPHALFCRECNGWIVIATRNAAIPPVTSDVAPDALPDPSARKSVKCDEHDSIWSPLSIRTHHYHRKLRAVDGSSLTPPLTASSLEPTLPSTISGTTSPAPDTANDDRMETDDPKKEDAALKLDLFACCQCQTNVYVSSDVIPGMIPTSLLNEFSGDKEAHPPLGKTREASVLIAWETILGVIERSLWKGDVRALNANGQKFQAKVGWSATVSAIFAIIGFRLLTSDNPDSVLRLIPPVMTTATEQGRRNRARMLRVWVEISAWLSIYVSSKGTLLQDQAPALSLWVRVASAREDYQRMIGAHPDQIPRADFKYVDSRQFDRRHWQALGMTLTTHSADLVEFAYMRQIGCAPLETPHFLFILSKIAKCPNLPEVSAIQSLVSIERSKGKWTSEDVTGAAGLLGFGENGDLQIVWDEDVDTEFLMKAWWNAWKEVDKPGFGASFWSQDIMDEQAAIKHRLREALRTLCEYKGTKEAMERYEEVISASSLTPNEAYTALGATQDYGDDMMITITDMRILDQPSQRAKMIQALKVVAEDRNSARLKSYVETGVDPGEAQEVSRPEWPRGLNQLGNTCYLNSLLQYFYTIKDLREAIGAGKFEDNIDLSEEEIKRNPIGGRLVSRKEVERSKRFVQLLSGLFTNLAWADSSAVTPEVELAKLALVTSKDEEAENSCKSDHTTSTGMTLVDEPLHAHSDTLAPTAQAEPEIEMDTSNSPCSVLGKRPGESLERHTRRATIDADVQNLTLPSTTEAEKDGFVATPSLVRSSTVPLSLAESAALSSDHTQHAIEPIPDVPDTVMKDSSLIFDTSQAGPSAVLPDLHAGASMRSPPPLPPRMKKVEKALDMMFGKQNDVAECMDNCMFQIEAAMQFDDIKSGDSGKNQSLVKRLFYGKKRQRIQPLAETAAPATVSVKEDIFAQLLVNVSDEGYDLYDGLSGFFDDTVEFEGSKAKMEVTLLELPPILQIQLQRVQFDRETMQQYKSNAYVKFEENLFVDRFLDEADPEKVARSNAIQLELRSCRERVAILTQTHQTVSYGDALANTLEFLSKQDILPLSDVDDGLLIHILSEQQSLELEIAQLRAKAAKLKADLEAVWRDSRNAEYELSSVFIHRGTSPSWGHYFFYSRHLPEAPNSWFKYNDSDVSLVAKEEVIADGTGSTANPYLLVYTRKSSNVIQTVHRQRNEIEEAVPSAPTSVEI